MMDISTPEILTNVEKISRDPDINFSRNGKFQNPSFSGKLSVPTSREETLIAGNAVVCSNLANMPLLIIVLSAFIKPLQAMPFKNIFFTFPMTWWRREKLKQF